MTRVGTGTVAQNVDGAATRSAQPQTPLVSLCVITFRRPVGLSRLVRSVARLDFPADLARIELNVVDNDADGSAKSICATLAQEVDFPLKYAVEPRRGIPFARNRSVAMIDPQAEFAIFVDDDEAVTPGWLKELLRVQQRHAADVVAGPVLARFLHTPPAWIVRGRFFELPRHATGTRIDCAYTNNTLVRVSALRKMKPLFDERLALTGGSDTHLFRRVHKAGFKMVWADDALVHDYVPASRMTVGWLVQRAFRHGALTPIIARVVRPSRGVATHWFGVAMYRIAKGLLFLPASWLFGRHHLVRCLRCAAYAAGVLAGWYGMRYDEYRRTHGR
jgi:succinoglycan biosynthesis protein ExoM